MYNHAGNREIKRSLIAHLCDASIPNYIVSPIIYLQILPVIFLDISVTLYQMINFSVYKIPKVPRRNYLIFDRHKLSYLNGLEKLNCLYCSYVNGIISYAREIASRTELHFCPIKHKKKLIGTHFRYRGFYNYGDSRAYHQHLIKIKDLRDTDKSVEG